MDRGRAPNGIGHLMILLLRFHSKSATRLALLCAYHLKFTIDLQVQKHTQVMTTVNRGQLACPCLTYGGFIRTQDDSISSREDHDTKFGHTIKCYISSKHTRKLLDMLPYLLCFCQMSCRRRRDPQQWRRHFARSARYSACSAIYRPTLASGFQRSLRPISRYYSHLVAVRGRCSISRVHAGTHIFVWIKRYPVWPRDWPWRPMSRMVIGQRLWAVWVCSQLSDDSNMKWLGNGNT